MADNSNELTLGNFFRIKTEIDPSNIDISWIQSIRLPEDGIVGHAMAQKLLSQSARAIDWCGEMIAILTKLCESSKDDYKKEHSLACGRSHAKSAQQSQKDADADPIYCQKKAKYNELYAFLKFMELKQKSFTEVSYSMRKILDATHREALVAGITNPDSVYENDDFQPRNAPTSDSPEEVDDFDL